MRKYNQLSRQLRKFFGAIMVNQSNQSFRQSISLFAVVCLTYLFTMMVIMGMFDVHSWSAKYGTGRVRLNHEVTLLLIAFLSAPE